MSRNRNTRQQVWRPPKAPPGSCGVSARQPAPPPPPRPRPPPSPPSLPPPHRQIGHAGDGGLYAEMVQDRSFEALATATGFLDSPATRQPLGDWSQLAARHRHPMQPLHTPWQARVRAALRRGREAPVESAAPRGVCARGRGRRPASCHRRALAAAWSSPRRGAAHLRPRRPRAPPLPRSLQNPGQRAYSSKTEYLKERLADTNRDPR